MTSTIRVTEVTKEYGRVKAVRGASFELGQGELVALIGHNGAGKTTLMKLMLGLIRPTSGSIEVLGDNPAAGEFAGRRQLGYLPENVSFDSALTGRETQAFYARLKREPVTKALDLLETVGLGPAARRRVGTYSKGMRQRLGLAQALIGHPRVLLKMVTPRRHREPGYAAQIAGELYGGSARRDPAVARDLLHLTSRLGPARGYFYQLMSGIGWTSLPRLRRLQPPTLILAGDDDPIIPLVNARIMHRLIPRSTLHVYSGGHLELAADAERLASAVEEFLDADLTGEGSEQ